MATNNQINSNFHQIAVADANANVTGVTTSGNITAAYFVGNGSALTGLAGGSNIANGTSNVSIPTVDSNVNIVVAGTNRIVATTTGANVAGTLDASGNISTAGQIQSRSFTGGNISWSTNNQVDFQGAIKVGGTGVIKSPGGAGSITLNNNGANIPILGVTNNSNSTSPTTGSLIVSGGAGVAGNIHSGGNLFASQVISNVATGTAPFTVTSTTRVANLNVNAANIADYIQTGTIYSGNFRIGTFDNSYSPIYGNTQFQVNAGTGILYTPNLVATGTITTANLSATGNISSNTNMSVKGFTETVTSATNTGTSIAPNVITGTIYHFTANADFTFNGFTNPIAGQSAVVLITQDGTGSRLMSSTMKFAGASKTLSTAPGAVDMICVLYSGVDYYASLAKGYA